ncbi:MAG: hypothetical protein FWD75_08415 [Propionibacteriaceae bacterium]|nr:hypothetical protein [Propionibacteriaceae bacterium]
MSVLTATEQKTRLKRTFFTKGLVIATVSGMAYGLYSAFVTQAMGQGVWGSWYGPDTVLSAFVVVYVLGVLGSGINDLVSAVWAVGIAGLKGKLMDFFRSVKTRPGMVIMACAVIGGPIASAAYIISLQMAGSIIAPITALCPALGAILSRFLFKQKLNLRMVIGILICLAATLMIGWSSLQADARPGAVLGCVIAFIAAVGWAIEGAVAGFGTTVVEYEIGITIRQLTSGVVNLLVVLPLMCFFAGHIGLAPRLVVDAVTSGGSMIFFVISGLFALFAYSLWYKGNSMCGTALGMACNGAYSFWVPFFCWLILGVFFGQDGWALQPIAWVAAVVMFLGILVIAVNPLEWFRRNTSSLMEEVA